MNPAFCLDISRCTGCGACVVACSDSHGLPPSVQLRHIEEFVESKGKGIRVSFMSLACNNCRAPSCVEHCPTGAMTRDSDGVVRHDAQRCVQCLACISACPYGAPKQLPDTGEVVKCDSCCPAGQPPSRPACVRACPARALYFGDCNQLIQEFGPGLNMAGLPDPTLTHPNLIVIRSRKRCNGDHGESS